jgi:lipopolysaccharide/colanic/teichoic acid biosynthesis glycosyltransferase
MIYPQPYFLQRLSEERNRSDRTERPFTLVVFPVQDTHLDTVDARGLLRSVEHLALTTRRSDLWGRYAKDKLGLILPDTSAVAAKEVISRLAHHLAGYPGSRPVYLAVHEGRYSLIEYPKNLKETVESELSHDARGKPETSRTRKDCPVPPNPLTESGLLEQTSLCPKHRTGNLGARLYVYTKRLIDFVGASVGILFLSSIAIPIAVLIKCTSRGPVLFKQKRVGRNGQPFTFLKFRTMYHDCDQTPHKEYVTRLIQDTAETQEQDGAAYYKLANDPRVTPLGRFLRRTSLDELPQFINVFKGEMSLVGPRPPIDYEVVNYEPWQLRRILEADPGITGLWQVSGRSTKTFVEQVRLDLRYVENQSLWQDMRILVKTFRVFFGTKSAC